MSVIENARNLVNAKPPLEAMLAQLADKSIPLDDRWEAYKILCEGDIITNIDTSSDGHTRILDNGNGAGGCSLTDDFYIDRFESANYTEMYESILEEGHPAYECEFTSESIDAWREAVLLSGDAGFKFDW